MLNNSFRECSWITKIQKKKSFPFFNPSVCGLFFPLLGEMGWAFDLHIFSFLQISFASAFAFLRLEMFSLSNRAREMDWTKLNTDSDQIQKKKKKMVPFSRFSVFVSTAFKNFRRGAISKVFFYLSNEIKFGCRRKKMCGHENNSFNIHKLNKNSILTT